MRDRYIDDMEMESYGQGFVNAAKTRGSLGPYLATLARAVAEATSALAQAGAQAGTIRSSLSSETPGKAAALKAGDKALTHVNDLLRAHRGAVNPKDFFPRERRHVRRSGAAVLAALGQCLAGLKKNASRIPGAAAEQKALEATAKKLAQSLARTSDARSSAAAVSPALRSARLRWKATYRAAKLGTESLLLLEARDRKKATDVASALRSFFHDLSGGRAPRKRQAAPASVSPEGESP